MAFPPVLIFNPAWQANNSFKQRNMKDEEIQERLALLLLLKRRRKLLALQQKRKWKYWVRPKTRPGY